MIGGISDEPGVRLPSMAAPRAEIVIGNSRVTVRPSIRLIKKRPVAWVGLALTGGMMLTLTLGTGAIGDEVCVEGCALELGG
jgi:hypothetical protein